MGLIKITVSLVMVALFGIAIIGFASNFATDNDSPVNINTDDEYSTLYAAQVVEVDNYFEDSNLSMDAMIKSTLESGDETTASGGQFKTGIGGLVTMGKDTIEIGYKKLFGEDNDIGIFLTALMALIVFILGAYAVKAWIGRNPD